MELIWPKRRIMEVYLNIAEWGPGIFGIEAASWHYFKKASARLTPREAARLAVALPNPFTRNAAAPGPGMQRLATIIQGRMRHVSRAGLACVLDAQRP
jgi:monofunctional glycosyltransferase